MNRKSTVSLRSMFSAGYAMIWRQGGFIIQWHEAETLNVVCHNVKVQPVLQEITGEDLTRCSNAPDARLDIHAPGFWAGHGFSFFDVWVCHLNAEFYKDLALADLSST